MFVTVRADAFDFADAAVLAGRRTQGDYRLDSKN